MKHVTCETFYLSAHKLSVRGFPGGSAAKESACNAGDLGSIPGLGRSPGEGNCKPFQYPCLENPMDRGARQATVHGVARVRHNLVTKPPPQFSGMFKDGGWRPSTFCYTFYAVPESVATSHDEINGNPLQYSCLEKPMERGAWSLKESDMTEQLNNNSNIASIGSK